MSSTIAKSLLISAAFAAAILIAPAKAKITRVEITGTQDAFGGQSFDKTGSYERLIGKAYGEVDPKGRRNRLIQDIELAPRNARGMVEYVTDIDILRPKNREAGNGVLFFNILNRGNKGGLNLFNADLAGPPAETNAVTKPGDGWLMKEGYTIIWFGWQGDVLPGDNRMLLSLPVAKNPDGSPVTGVVRSELTTFAPTTTLNVSSGWFTGMTHAPYPTVSTDNTKPFPDGFLPTLTVRSRENAPRMPIAASDWSFGACPAGAPATVSDRQICLKDGFKPGKLYELIYRAKDPMVMGLGFAAMRDIGAFFKNEKSAANPVFHKGAKAIAMGTSQSGRFLRSFIHLGFNGDESGRQVFEGALPHIGGGLMPLNLRFAPAGRAWGAEIDHLYPAYDFPFSYVRQKDPITGRRQGLLDRCTAAGNCPLIVHAATALEVWEGRQSLGFTDPLGKRDVADPKNVRTYIMASTQHGAAGLPLPAAEPFGQCVLPANPNPHTWTMRALLAGLTGWVKDGAAPPASAVPRITDATLVSPDQVRFPFIPTNAYGNVRRPEMRFSAVTNPLHALDYGPAYNAGDSSGVITQEPPRTSPAAYGVLVPQVDADGIDLAGIRSAYLQAPIGTYTSWNRFRDDRFSGGFCNFQGTFVPFARTRQERLDAGDPRLSIEERYPTPAAYASAFRRGAEALVAQHYLLPADAARLIKEAETGGIRLEP